MITKDLPANLLASDYRQHAWEKARLTIERLSWVMPLKAVFVLGSFTTDKLRPADVDFIVLIEVADDEHQEKSWSVDLVISPANKYGTAVLQDAKIWAEEKYGPEGCRLIRVI